MSSQLAWEVVPTPRVGNSPVPIQHQETPVIHKSKPTAVQEKVLTKSDLLFIKDLNPAEKSKIGLMIQQIVKLEHTCDELREELEAMTRKLEKKSELCSEAEECMEGLASENEKLKSENHSKDEILREYSRKLEETSKLLKVTSAANKKLQKRLNVKRSCKHVQTETTGLESKDSQTTSLDFASPPRKPDVVEDSMTLFLHKLDSLCDKLTAVEREPVKSSEQVLVHNHKKEGELVSPGQNPDLTFQAEESSPVKPVRHTDSVILVREQTEKRAGGEGKRYPEKRGEDGERRFDDRLISLIDELEESEREEETLLDDLFFKVK